MDIVHTFHLTMGHLHFDTKFEIFIDVCNFLFVILVRYDTCASFEYLSKSGWPLYMSCKLVFLCRGLNFPMYPYILIYYKKLNTWHKIDKFHYFVIFSVQHSKFSNRFSFLWLKSPQIWQHFKIKAPNLPRRASKKNYIKLTTFPNSWYFMCTILNF